VVNPSAPSFHKPGSPRDSRHAEAPVPGSRFTVPSCYPLGLTRLSGRYAARLCDIGEREASAMQIKKGYKQLLAEANAEIETLTPADAIALHGRSDTVFVDLRDPREIAREGGIPGAFACTRGMLEFWIDPESPYAKPIFAEPRRFVFFCAGGWRSALATKTAKDMGLEHVAHIEGGFGSWKQAAGPVEPPKSKG
jgi:rhodanese-related sulfurtransferase